MASFCETKHHYVKLRLLSRIGSEVTNANAPATETSVCCKCTDEKRNVSSIQLGLQYVSLNQLYASCDLD
jgi:hypothetical protein